MYNKKKNVVFGLVLALIVCVMVGFIIFENADSSKENNTLSSEELAALSEKEREEEEALYEEYNEMISNTKSAMSNAEYHKGGYEDRKDSREINQAFITNEYKFRQILSYSEMEFLEYEEIDDLTEYFKDAVVQDGAIKNYAECGFLDDELIGFINGTINTDGTFNSVEQICRVRYGDLNYGDEVYRQNQELMAVRLTVKYMNLSAKENVLPVDSLQSLENLVFLDDGKLYRSTSVYKYDYTPDTTYVCTNMVEKLQKNGDTICSSSIVLQPKEEYIGQIVFVFFKEEFDDMYLIINAGQVPNIENFNSVDVKLLPFTELKKLEKK